MKFRSKYYLESVPTPGTKFLTESDVWEWSRAEKAMVKLDTPHDDFAEIQSHSDCALEKIFDKYGPEGLMTFASSAQRVAGESDEVNNVDLAQDDLDELDDIYDTVEDMRQRYGLGREVPVLEVLRTVELKTKEILNNAGKVAEPVGRESSSVLEPSNGDTHHSADDPQAVK